MVVVERRCWWRPRLGIRCQCRTGCQVGVVTTAGRRGLLFGGDTAPPLLTVINATWRLMSACSAHPTAPTSALSIPRLINALVTAVAAPSRPARR
jgi:hypothetical protein